MTDIPTLDRDLPATLTVPEGDPLRLDVRASGPPGARLDYSWTHDGRPIPGLDSPALAQANAAAADAGRYAVSVTATLDGQTSAPATSTTCTVTVTSPPPAPGKQPDVPLVWDASFAKTVFTGGVALLGAGWLVLLVVVSVVSDTGRMVAIGLLMVSIALGVSGCVLALLDLRGRARIAEAGTTGRGFGEDAITQLPDIIKNFGALGLASAVLLLAAVAMICATVIGWRALPDPGPAAPGSPATSTSSPTPAAVPAPPALPLGGRPLPSTP